ncbi:MAG: hypothetical protein MJZ86_02920 [Bacteroidales bacterium]|nr:hypothetical protein [Bacteroidales bacterium]
MFGFFKKYHKKPRPIYEALGTDIHCHLLPNVDDGSKSAVESATYLGIMKEAGFSNIILTPHFQDRNYTNVEEDILNRFETFKKDVEKYPTPNLVGVAGEYRFDTKFRQRVKDRKFLFINDKFLLFELNMGTEIIGVEEVLFEIQTDDVLRDKDIILAHPERYNYYSSHAKTLERLKDMGIYFQVNILSLSGFYGESERKKGFEMINNGWVEFLGTDLHTNLYSQALIDSTYDKDIEKLLNKHTFYNNRVLDPVFTISNKI